MGKMICKLSFLVVISFLLASSPTWADGNFLLRSCIEAEKVLDDNPTDFELAIGYCIGMTKGVSKTMIFFDSALAASGMEKPSTCWPNPISNQQLVRVVVKYLKDNPANLHGEEHVLIMQSLRDAFKCK
jgi:hypothetical protein